MAQYYYDFAGTNGGNLPPGFSRAWITGTTGNEFSVRPPYLQLSAATNARRAVSTGISATDADVRLKCRVIRPITDGTGAATFGPGIIVRGSGANASVNQENGYAATLGNQNNRDAALFKYVSATFSPLDLNPTALAAALTTLTWYWVRLQATGSTIRYKVWKDGDSEPGSWTASVTDTSLTGSGFIGIVGIGTTTFDFAEIYIGTGTDLAPTSPVLKTVSGTVLNDAGAPDARTVRAYLRETGGFLGETTSNGTTGAYSISTSATAVVNVDCLDDSGGTVYNDLILRTTPV